MRYWWVNQNQTYRHEVRGGYLWSPQRKSNEARNYYYESMREVSPGDLVFSFADTYIRAVGIARSYCYECPRPDEFGNVGHQWDKIGWRVDVAFEERREPIRPREFMSTLAPLLPERYAPLRPNGDGLQAVYLTELPPPFALALATIVGNDILALAQDHRAADISRELAALAKPPQTTVWEDELQRRIETDAALRGTEKEALVLARRGQGVFRAGVRKVEHECRITKVDRMEHLRASHCKPWRDSNNAERLDPENGLLLTPSVDHLFDKGFIAFEGNGNLLISKVADQLSLNRMGVITKEVVNVGRFSEGQRKYLEFHREHVFLSTTGTT